MTNLFNSQTNMKSIAPKNKATPRDTPITSNECLTVSCLEGQVIFLNSKRDSLKKLTSFENINIIPIYEFYSNATNSMRMAQIHAKAPMRINS